MHLMKLLVHVHLLILATNTAEVPCTDTAKIETIPLQFTNTVSEANCGPDKASLCIPADAGFPEETPEGWKYVSPGNNTDGRGNKINWYFQAAWYQCPTPDILMPSPAQNTPHLTLGCLNDISFNVKGKMEQIFIRIYTKPKGDGNDVSWYRSRLLLSATDLNTANIDYPTFTTITASRLNVATNSIYLPLTKNIDNCCSNSKASNLQEIFDNEEILAIAFSTNSGRLSDGTYNVGPGDNDFVINQFTVKYDDGCTCPTTRTFDLTGIEQADIGGSCTEDVGSCDICTCKQQCIHQDGLDGGFAVRKGVISSDECCAICNQINEGIEDLLEDHTMDISPALMQRCMGYTYLKGWDRSDCCQRYEAGDCVLFGGKLNECTASRYGISGSVNDGVCNVESSIGDCCDGIDCVDGICEGAGDDNGGDEDDEDESNEWDIYLEVGNHGLQDDSDDKVILNGKKPKGEENNKDHGESSWFAKDAGNKLVVNLDLISWIHLWGMAIVMFSVNVMLCWCYPCKRNEDTEIEDVDENMIDITKIEPVINDEYVD